MLTRLTLIVLLLTPASRFLAQVGKVGINTTSPAAVLHVADSSVLFSAPPMLPGSPAPPPVIGPGNRMMWYADKAAIRGGGVDGTQWDRDSTGLRSAAFGLNGKAKGNYSFVGGGDNNAANATGAFVGGGVGNRAGALSTFVGGGASNTVLGLQSFIAGGFSNSVSGPNAFAGGGVTNVVSGGMGFAAGGSNNLPSGVATLVGGGEGLLARSYGEVVLGTFNVDYTPASTTGIVATDRLFIIGNGTATNARKNAMTILKNGRTGIGTAAPSARLHVADSSVLFSAPSMLPGSPALPPVSGEGNRMLWYADKAAVRAGGVDGTQWDRDSTGLRSAAFGLNGKAKGNYSFVGGGDNNAANAAGAFVGGGVDNRAGALSTFIGGGASNTVLGLQSFIGGGFSHSVSGPNAFAGGGVTNVVSGGMGFAAGGSNNLASGVATLVAGGEGLFARSYGEVVLGTFNVDYTPASTTGIVATDRLFVVGNGTATNARKNAMTILKNGRAGIGTAMPNARLHVADSSVLFSAPSMLPGSPALPPMSGPGNRMFWYADKAAIRVGSVNGSQWDRDSIGTQSAVFGENSVAKGLHSFVGGGSSNRAIGDNTFTGGGTSNRANSPESFVGGGHFNSVSGSQSFIGGGANNQAQGLSAFVAGGFYNQASGDNSFVGGGQEVFARSYAEAVFGLFNTDYSPSGVNFSSSNDRLFVIGNGTGAMQRSNAITVLKNGRTGIGTDTPEEVLHVEGTIEVDFKIQANDADGLELATDDGTTRVKVADTGNVGIGTNSPARRLHVSNGVSGATTTTNAAAVFEDDQSATIQLLTPSSSGSGVVFGNELNTSDGAILYNNGSAPRGLLFRTNNNVNRMVISDNGDVGIGITTPSFQLHVNTNSAGKPTSNVWTVASDVRLKRNVHDYTDGLAALMKIHPVWFTYTGEAGLPEDTGVGVIAQELQEVAPYMVGTWTHEAGGQKTEYLSVDNGAMTYMLINAVREQQAIIEAQRSALASQDDRLSRMEQELAVIKNLLTENQANILVAANEKE